MLLPSIVVVVLRVRPVVVPVLLPAGPEPLHLEPELLARSGLAKLGRVREQRQDSNITSLLQARQSFFS